MTASSIYNMRNPFIKPSLMVFNTFVNASGFHAKNSSKYRDVMRYLWYIYVKLNVMIIPGDLSEIIPEGLC